MTQEKQEKYKTALVGKWLKWDVETYLCNIVELDFGDVSIDRTIGLHLRHKNGNYNFQRFTKKELETLILKGEYERYKLLNAPDQLENKSEQVQAIIDRTTKDITAIKGLFNAPIIAEMIDEAAKEWLITLRATHTYFKSKDEL